MEDSISDHSYSKRSYTTKRNPNSTQSKVTDDKDDNLLTKGSNLLHTLVVKLHQRWINSQSKLNQINSHIQKAKIELFSNKLGSDEQMKETINNRFLELIGQVEEILSLIKKPALSAMNSFQESKEFNKSPFGVTSQISQEFEAIQQL